MAINTTSKYDFAGRKVSQIKFTTKGISTAYQQNLASECVQNTLLKTLQNNEIIAIPDLNLLSNHKHLPGITV